LKKREPLQRPMLQPFNDGAAAIIIAGEDYKDQAKFKIRSWSGHAQDPTWFTTAPVEAVKRTLLKKV
jgi:acetyl-CoA C-acetyltransferase